MIFRAFFDESGTNPKEDKALTFGGFIGHIEEWETVTEAWDQCLNESPRINYFSHHEADTLDGQFLRFDRKAAEAKKCRLAEVIAQHRLQGVCATVPHEWFVDRDSKVTKGMVGTRAYDWGFITATSGVLQWMEKMKNPQYTVDFIFDERRELDTCISLFSDLKRSGMVRTMEHAGDCLAGDDKKLAALQMADLLAGEYSHINENGPPSKKPFSIIATARPVIHLPCTPPPQVPNVLAVQKFGAGIRREALDISKRIYKDNEKSLELVRDVEELRRKEAYFWIEFQRLCDSYSEGGFRRFLEELPDENRAAHEQRFGISPSRCAGGSQMSRKGSSKSEGLSAKEED